MLYMLSWLTSFYAGPDIPIGIFTKIQHAEAAQKTCVEVLICGDHWREQASRKDDLQSNFKTFEVQDCRPDKNSVTGYVVSMFCDSLGILTREYLSIHSNYRDAEKTADELERVVDAQDVNDVPCYWALHYFEVSEIEIGPQSSNVLKMIKPLLA